MLIRQLLTDWSYITPLGEAKNVINSQFGNKDLGISDYFGSVVFFIAGILGLLISIVGNVLRNLFLFW